MRHDWIFDVLSDLHAYADRNALAELAHKLEEALAVARWELGEEAEAGPPPPFRSARRAH
ncbi:hypothetical protein [Tabrizicola aquatica]|uniref:hypothetical protein n=1 Tax=Tabrizicola aquatica TaxID=909926 RepID=UPI000CD07E63|nr:hypothetical protein [Tabrizicola aquatica]